MPGTLNFKKVSRTIKIFAVAQIGLVAMLIYMAILFQGQMLARAGSFMTAVIATVIIQLTLFYPIYKFSSREADRDLTLTGANLSKEETKALAKKKRYSDIIKASTFFFFVMFILKAPNNPLILSVLYFSFILIILSYLQCYNFAAKKLMKEHQTPRI